MNPFDQHFFGKNLRFCAVCDLRTAVTDRKADLIIRNVFKIEYNLFAVAEPFPQIFAGIFTPDASLIDFTAKALRIYCGAMFLFGIQIACQMTFVSIGNAPCSIIVAIVRKFVLLLPFIYIMPNIVADKTMGVYLAEPAADVIAVTFTAILFAVQFKKSLKKLEQEK